MSLACRSRDARVLSVGPLMCLYSSLCVSKKNVFDLAVHSSYKKQITERIIKQNHSVENIFLINMH